MFTHVKTCILDVSQASHSSVFPVGDSLRGRRLLTPGELWASAGETGRRIITSQRASWSCPALSVLRGSCCRNLSDRQSPASGKVADKDHRGKDERQKDGTFKRLRISTVFKTEAI